MNKTKFKKSEDIPEYQYFHVHTSDQWGIALYRVLFGFRVRIWKLSNTYSCEADLCFGSDLEMIDLGYRTLLAYLENGGFPEEIPFQTVKPFPKSCEFTTWLGEQITQFPEAEKGKVTLRIVQSGIVKPLSGLISNEHKI